MTVIVGVQCTDGVVIGADSVATSSMGSQHLIQIETEDKIKVFEEQVIVATTGSVGYTQRLHTQLEAAMKGGVFKNLTRDECFGNISKRFLKDLEGTMAQIHSQAGLRFGGLMGCALKDVPYLVEYDSVGFQPEVKQKNLFFVSMGSGQQLADPFLAFVSRVLWNNTMPTVREAKLGVYWVLDLTIRLAPGGVGKPIRIATLEKRDSKWLGSCTTELQEASEYIAELEKMIGEQARTLGKKEPPEPVPKPAQA